MNWQGQRVLIMAGGTGGHVYPALSVAEELSALGAEIYWFGNARGFEAERVRAAGYPLFDLAMHGLRGQKRFSTPFMLARALWRAWRGLKKIQPQAVLGFGGYLAAPGGWLAAKMGIPLFIHEQNARVGWVNRRLAPLARRVLLAHPQAAQHLQELNITAATRLVGNPVRRAITAVEAPTKRFLGRHGAIRLLVLGGSQGAQVFNRLLPEALALLAPEERPQVLHQTGRGQEAETEALYQRWGVKADVRAYIEDMASAYAQADWMMARAGALSVAEIASVGLSALLVPFPHAVDDHQYANAQVLVEAGAAQCLRQEHLTAARLADIIRQQRVRGELLKHAELARMTVLPGASQRIIQAMAEALAAPESAS